MSHFSTLVITKKGGRDVDELLAPYSETLEVAPYIRSTKAQMLKENAKWRQQTTERMAAEKLEDPVAYEERYSNPENIPPILNMTDEEYYQKEIQNEEVDKDGNLLTTYNPNAKWDWYVPGGRYQGLLITKSGKKVDSCKFKDLDLDAMNKLTEEDEHDATRFWEINVEDSPLQKGETAEQYFTFYNKEYYLEKYGNKEEYLSRLAKFSTYAVVTSNGIWHSPGDMGWFGSSSESFDELEEWEKNYTQEFLTNLDPDDVITMIDCHI